MIARIRCCPRPDVLLILALLMSAPAAAATPPAELDLRDCMDSYYGAGNWTRRTGAGIGSDIGPALDACLTTLRSDFGRGKIIIPPGLWLMSTPPSAALLSGNYIEGFGSQASLIVFNNSNAPAFHFSGAGGYTGGGIRGIALLLESGLGNTNSYGIYLVGDATYQPDQMEFSDIYLSAIGGSSYWWEAFHADGAARTSPQGIRVVNVSNVQLFNSRNVGAYIRNAVQWSITNVGTYTGTGTGNDVHITGNGSATTNTIQLSASRLYVGGALHLTNASDLAIEGKAGSVVTNSTATLVSGWLNAGSVSGAIGSNSSLTIAGVAPVRFRAHKSGSDQSNVGTGSTKITFSNTDYNIGSRFSTVTGTFTAPRAGLYSFGFNVYFLSVADNKSVSAFLGKNGSTPAGVLCMTTAAGAHGLSCGATTEIELAANDTIALYAQTETSLRTVDGPSYATNFWGREILP